MSSNTGFKRTLKDTFQSNGTLFTVAAIILILVSGVSIADNKDNWWWLALSFAGFFFMVFLFINARVVIKASVVSLLTLFISAGAFQLGTFLDPHGLAGLVWMGQVLFLFFGPLSLSYLSGSGRSRWSLLGTTQILTAMLTYTLLLVIVAPTTSILAGLIFGSVFFVTFYKFFGKTRFKSDNVPENVTTDKLSADLIESFEKKSWFARAFPFGKNPGGVLVWKDKAYLLLPVRMDEPFTNTGGRFPQLTYKRQKLNPWLLSILFGQIPSWRSRGADITLVLLDTTGKNGSSKIIGVGIPDTKKKIPVGVIPVAKNLNNASLIIKELEENLDEFKVELSSKQKVALSRFGQDSTKITDVDSAKTDESKTQENGK